MRKALQTVYKDEGEECGLWWLRSLGWSMESTHCAGFVGDKGYISRRGEEVNGYFALGIRPALHLNLSSGSEWSYAGTVTVFGGEADVPEPSPEETGKPSPSAIPTKAPGTVNPAPAPVIQPQAPVSLPSPAVQKPGRVNGLKLKALKKGIQASWKKSRGVTGYEIWISGSKNFSKKTVTKSKTAKFTLKDLKRNRTYYVKIRAYTKTGGKVKYGKWSKVEKVKCK